MNSYIIRKYERDIRSFLDRLKIYIDEKRDYYNVMDDHTILVDGIYINGTTHVLFVEI